MSNNQNGRIIFTLSLPLAIMIIFVSATGIFSGNFYFRETLNWQAQSIGQDIVDLLLITPVLLLLSILAYRNSKMAQLLWGGVILFIVYTFVIYCFAVHFNNLFIVYCLTLGLSFYSLGWFFIIQAKNPLIKGVRNLRITRVIGIYFLVITILFYFLWLSEIVPAMISNTIPVSLAESGLYTNPVHVIDLSVLLPGLFLTGVLLLKNKSTGIFLTPLFLLFVILMDINIGTLVYIMKLRGLEAELFVTMFMSLLAVLSTVLLVLFLKNLEFNNE